MIIYADVLFFINFSMDFLSLFFCSKILHIKASKIRLIASSSVGAAYATIQVFFDMKALYGILLSVLVASIMLFIAFEVKRARQFGIMLLMYLFISATLGGIMSVIYAFFNKVVEGYIVENMPNGSYNSARNIIIIGLTAIATLIVLRVFISKKDVKAVEVCITLYGKEYEISGLCDSGNLLTEPFSGRRVILVSEDCELGKSINKTETIYKKIIPYRDVSSSGMLYGVVPSSVIIEKNKKDAIIATVKNKNFNGYDALVPSSLL